MNLLNKRTPQGEGEEEEEEEGELKFEYPTSAVTESLKKLARPVEEQEEELRREVEFQRERREEATGEGGKEESESSKGAAKTVHKVSSIY